MLVHYTEIGVEFQIPNSNGLMSCADTLSNFIKTLLQFWPIRSTHFFVASSLVLSTIDSKTHWSLDQPSQPFTLYGCMSHFG